MKRIRTAAVAVGAAGALSLGALVAVPALADSDDATGDPPAPCGQVIDDADEAMPNPNCTGAQDRDREQLRIRMQDHDGDGAQMRHQHGLANGNERAPGWGHGQGPGPGTGECPYDAD
ncbi:MAG TPA: hypothetical protein VFZ37_01335 [Jiangellaceae bacterium]